MAPGKTDGGPKSRVGARKGEGAAPGLDNVGHDGESQSAPRAPLVEAAAAGQGFLPTILGNAGTVVGHAEGDIFALRTAADRHGMTGMSRRVLEQVADRLRQIVAIDTRS